jgi:hypothetical protein
VAAAEEEEVAGHVEAVGEQRHQALDGLLVAAGVVAEEEVVHELGVAAAVDDVGQLEVVAQRARADVDRPVDSQQAGLRQHLLPHPAAQAHELLLADPHALDIGLDGVQLDSVEQVLKIDCALVLRVSLPLALPQLSQLFYQQIHYQANYNGLSR